MDLLATLTRWQDEFKTANAEALRANEIDYREYRAKESELRRNEILLNTLRERDWYRDGRM